MWSEIHSLGPMHELEPALARDVRAVAERTVQRAWHNVTTLYERLVYAGYVFENEAWACAPASNETEAVRSRLLREGDVPPVLDAWLRHAGMVSFRGWLPSYGPRDAWEALLLDPFEFGTSVADVEEALAERSDDARTVAIDIAGDYLHKNDVSGGMPTFIRLPSALADAKIVEDDGVWFARHARVRQELGSSALADTLVPFRECEPIWLVDYLRLYFESAGFRRVAGSTGYPEKALAQLTKDLLPI